MCKTSNCSGRKCVKLPLELLIQNVDPNPSTFPILKKIPKFTTDSAVLKRAAKHCDR